ncbi:MAG: hypothetical protein APZ16_00270 [Candidatus Hadarchaeum yellowstonense]|uniref:ArnR1-like winged helix-turn-helix domain-containing protein n=1 Tax=Hadarchaeum yellowstonense TaxID=1776334 RepID=A0A147JSN6_HADYE|nr:MAG: hypothetical protein APZ16_00270 [Candidatus Hadarchaeum yellowstonense]
MGCVSPDGRPTESGKKLLQAAVESRTPEEIAEETKLPLFRVRSGLRDLTEAGYLREEGGRYLLTDSGKEALRKAGVVV